MLLENRNISRRVETDLSEMRLQYRIKCEELERISHIYEETTANLKSTKLENEMIREKLAVLKSEYYKIEAKAKGENADVKAQNAVLKEKLENYEAIEQEVDNAVMNLAKDGVPDDPNNVYLATLSNMPTTTKRRMH